MTYAAHKSILLPSQGKAQSSIALPSPFPKKSSSTASHFVSSPPPTHLSWLSAS